MMNKHLSWIGAAATATVLALGQPGTPAYALDRRSGDLMRVPAGQVVDDDLAAAGRQLTIEGTVRGDVFALAESVRVTGVVDGDLIVATKSLVIDGQVKGDVRAAGSFLQMNGEVLRNVTAAGQVFQLSRSGRVDGNLIGAGDSVSIDGDVGGTFSGAGRDVAVLGRIARSADVAVQSLSLGPNARIGGNLTYYAQQPQTLPEGVVAGQVKFEQTQSHANRPPVPPVAPQLRARPHFGPSQVFNSIWNFFSLAWLAGSAVVGLILLRVFPRFVAEFLGVLESRPLPSLGMGALTLIGTIPAAILVGLTVIGLPLSGLLVAGYFSGIFLGWLLLAVAVGSILVGVARGGRPWHHSWSFLLGLLVLFLATKIPVAGGLLAFLGTSLGMGALLLTLHRTWRTPDRLAGPFSSGPLPTPSPAI